MPKAFDECIKRGGRVRTKKIGKNKIIRFCFIGGKSYVSEVKTIKKKR